MDSFEKTVELSMLYDFYGELLGEHKKEIFEDYVLNDLSLTEIAEMKGITRQGVHDIIKKSSKKLYEYEDKLQLVKRFKASLKICDEIREIAETFQNEEGNKIINLVDEIKKNGI